MIKPKCPKGYKLNGNSCRRVKRKTLKGIFKSQSKNPFKVWGSYAGLVLGLIVSILTVMGDAGNGIFLIIFPLIGFFLGYGVDFLDHKIYGKNKILDYLDFVLLVPLAYGFIATWTNYLLETSLPSLWFSNNAMMISLLIISLFGYFLMNARINEGNKWRRIVTIVIATGWFSWVAYMIATFSL